MCFSSYKYQASTQAPDPSNTRTYVSTETGTPLAPAPIQMDPNKKGFAALADVFGKVKANGGTLQVGTPGAALDRLNKSASKMMGASTVIS